MSRPRWIRRRRARGGTLLDALAALAILSIGLLALARFQARGVAYTTEAQQRSLAVTQAEQLLSLALIDRDNVGCYALPAGGVPCANPAAAQRAQDWRTALPQVLPQAVATATVQPDGRVEVQVDWTGQGSRDQRSVRLSTDVQ